MQLVHALAFVAPASAFLVVPEMIPPPPSDVESDFKILPVDIEVNPLAIPPTAAVQSLSVPCTGCADNSAKARFDLEVKDNTRLLVNGFEVYPAEQPPTGIPNVAVETSEWGIEEPVISWIAWWQVMNVDEAQKMQMVDLHVNAKIPLESVSGAGSNVGLVASLIVGPNGEVLIAEASPEIIEVEVEPPCEGLLCRVEEVWNRLTQGGMGCHKAQEMVDSVPEMENGQPNESEPGHQHLGKMIKDVVGHVFLPIVMGITAGVGAAAMAMFLCSLVGFVARKIAGRDTRYSWVMFPAEMVVIEEQAEGEDEKDGLIAGQEAPPAYEAPTEKE